MPKASKSTTPAKKAPAKAAPAATKKSVPAAKTVAKAAPAKAPAAKSVAKAPAAKAPAKPVAKAPAKAAPAKTPAPVAKKAPPKKVVIDKFLEGQIKALADERENYTRQATSLRAEADQLAAEREPGDVQFDEESGQGDTMNVERERDLALSAQALASIDEIDRTIGKIHAGSYGICERCGENIPRERLRALPFAALCVTCKAGGLSAR
jgi:DnaK suppressor protein